ncbi:MAG: hypothetical protein KVP17_004987 [Porospora cf. gigantea B]|uniref:uncharacterized protein n=1 Tax=Porospora cf. gigantea B TaxID=2853592 RepID=UPI0035718C7B|nr:MAG: hypothetical protein KVP17_004987 [Porospora cf. gigantea B]
MLTTSGALRQHDTVNTMDSVDDDEDPVQVPAHVSTRKYPKEYSQIERNDENALIFQRRTVDGFYIANFSPQGHFMKHGHVQTIWGSQYLQEALRMLLFDIPIIILRLLTLNTALWAAIRPKLRYLYSGRAWARENYLRSYWQTIDHETLMLDILLHDRNCGADAPPSASEIAHVEACVSFEYVTTWKTRKSHPTSPDRGRATVDRSSTRPVTIIVHGLENHSRSPQVLGLARWSYSKGFDVFALNHRGCAAMDYDGLKQIQRILEDDTVFDYHGGFVDDLLYVSQIIRLRRPKAKIYVSGYSLGGNIVAKFLGVLGHKASEFNVHGGFGLCVPFDEETSNLDANLFNRTFYVPGLLLSLKFKAGLKLLGRVYRRWNRFGRPRVFRLEDERKQESLADPDLPRSPSLPALLEPVYHHVTDFLSPLTRRLAENAEDLGQLRGMMRADKLGGFIENYSSPIWGFANPQTFYDENASWRFFHRIRVPFLVVNSYDDPFFLAEKYPIVRDLELQGANAELGGPTVRLAPSHNAGASSGEAGVH